MAEYRKILTCVCLALQFIVLGLLVYSVFQELAPDSASLWTSLWQPSVSARSAAQRLGCGPVDGLVKAAAAFTITSIVITLGALVLTILNITGVAKVSNKISLLVCVTASFTTLASCACLLGAKNRQCDDVMGEMKDHRLKFIFSMAGLGMSAVAWVLQIVVSSVVSAIF